MDDRGETKKIQSEDEMNIYKYQLQITEQQTIEIPYNARILHVDNQRHQLCLWALVDPRKACEPVTIYVHGTGQDVVVHPTKRYVGSVIMEPFVWHVFAEFDHVG